MGAKKKGKGSKLARMSEEERLRYLQYRAAVEEEARRRKEQLIATFMKNKLKREEAFSRLNVAKINQQWRQTLRSYKCVELRQDLEALFKWFVHTASKKTKQIDVLLDDLDEAEIQYSRIHQCHTEIVEWLFGSVLDDIHQKRIDFFQRQYEEDRKNIYEKAMDEMSKIVSSSKLDEDHLKAILFRTNETHGRNIEGMEAKQIIKADELRNNILTELENLMTSREARIEELWKTMQNILKNYWEETEDRTREYIILRDADIDNCKQIFLFHQQITNSNEAIISLKEELLRTMINREERVQIITKEKEEYKTKFDTLRNGLKSEREKDKRNLNFLTTAAQNSIKVLSDIHKKGEQIVQLLSLCKKLQILTDKINLYVTDGSYLNEDQEDMLEEETKKFKENLVKETLTNLSKLDKFWKHYNRVLIEKESLSLNIKSLQLEQKELKNTLKSYISDTVLIKPSIKVRVNICRPFTTQLPKSSSSMLHERKISSSIPYIEAIYTPTVRQMLNLKMGK